MAVFHPNHVGMGCLKGESLLDVPGESFAAHCDRFGRPRLAQLGVCTRRGPDPLLPFAL